MVDVPYHAPYSYQPIQACMAVAARDYGLPNWVLPAIYRVEGGKSGAVRSNSDGTKDYGAMQINTVWVDRFYARYGIHPEVIRRDDCTNVRAAAYIIRSHINATGSLWNGIGRYHSKTPSRKYSYAWKVYYAALELRK